MSDATFQFGPFTLSPRPDTAGRMCGGHQACYYWPHNGYVLSIRRLTVEDDNRIELAVLSPTPDGKFTIEKKGTELFRGTGFFETDHLWEETTGNPIDSSRAVECLRILKELPPHQNWNDRAKNTAKNLRMLAVTRLTPFECEQVKVNLTKPAAQEITSPTDRGPTNPAFTMVAQPKESWWKFFANTVRNWALRPA